MHARRDTLRLVLHPTRGRDWDATMIAPRQLASARSAACPCPAPRPTATHVRRPNYSFPHLQLPPSFGRNQIIPVADSTRALLEDIVAQFEAPIRYAFAYGSGVFEQEGYKAASPGSKEGPMIDFMFAVTHASHWHSINMHQYPGHYPLYARTLGSSFVSQVEDVSPGVWFNAFVPMKGVVCLRFTFFCFHGCIRN